MGQDLKAGLAGQSVPFAAWTTATGVAVTITADTPGLSLWYQRGVNGAVVPITPIDLDAMTDVWAAGGIIVKQAGGQEHRLDLPDVACAVGANQVSWGGSATGITIDGGIANLIGQPNTAAYAELLPYGLLKIVGPAWAALFRRIADYEDAPAWQGSYQSWTVYLTWDGTDTWQIGTTLGGAETGYTRSDPSPIGDWEAAAETIAAPASGLATESGTAGSFQPNDTGHGYIYAYKDTVNGRVYSAALDISIGPVTGNSPVIILSWDAVAGADRYVVNAVCAARSLDYWWDAVSGLTQVVQGLERTNDAATDTPTSPWTPPAAICAARRLSADTESIKGIDADIAIATDALAVLVANNLDHLCKTPTAGADMTLEVVDGTVLSRALAGGDTSTFAPATHSQKQIAADAADAADDAYDARAASEAVETLAEEGGDGDLAAMAVLLAAIKAKTDTVTGGQVTIASPVSRAGTKLELWQGDTYTVERGQPIDFDDPGDWPGDIDEATLTLTVYRTSDEVDELTVEGEVVPAGGGEPQKARFEPVRSDTAALSRGVLSHGFKAVATWGTEPDVDQRTLVYGDCDVL
jgi:hypothetical protein